MSDRNTDRNFEREGLGTCTKPGCCARISIIDPDTYAFYCENKHLSEYFTRNKFEEFQKSLPNSIKVNITKKCSGCKKIVYHHQPETWQKFSSGMVYCSSCIEKQNR